MKPPKKKKRKAGKRKGPKRMTIDKTRTHTRVTVKNPKKRKRAKPKKRKAAPKRSTTVTVRPNPKKKRKAKRRGPDDLARMLPHLARSPRHRPGDRAVPNAAYWKQPRAARAANLRKLTRGTPRQKRAAVAIARAEISRAEGPPRRSNPGMSDQAALAEYERTHWGKRGNARISRAMAANPRHGTATKLGKLVKVIYLTEKGGDDAPTEYDHDFEGELPELAYNDGGLLIAGGSYRIKEGGIDG